MTGVFILNDLVRQGRIRRGMVVSGEYISELGRNAAQEVRDVLSDQLPSLTLGDAGAAAILERAPEGAPGIEVAGFTTLSGHSRLCVAFPATIGPGVTMHTKARENRPDVAEDARYAPVKGFLAAVPGRSLALAFSFMGLTSQVLQLEVVPEDRPVEATTSLAITLCSRRNWSRALGHLLWACR